MRIALAVLLAWVTCASLAAADRVDDGLTVIVLANVAEGGGFAVDAMSKAIGLSSSSTATASTTIECLGEERATDGHFNLDPATNQLLGVVVED